MGPDDFKTVEEWYQFWKSDQQWEIQDWDGFAGIDRKQLITYNQFLEKVMECTLRMRMRLE